MDYPHLKNLTIVKTGAREFSNRLLNRLSVEAFALECGARVRNPARFGTGLFKIPHALYARYIGQRFGKSSLRAWRPPVYLPPTASLPAGYEHSDTLYFFGWVFRNPVGLEKHRVTLLKKFAPSAGIGAYLDHLLEPYAGKVRIGVEIKQTPYPGFPEGDFLVSPERTKEIVGEYLVQKNLSKENVVIIVSSDLPVDPGVFKGMNIFISHEPPKINFYLLSRCSAIIGSNATRANLPAWFGNVPHIVATRAPIDWSYYRSKKKYFVNKYATFAHGLARD